MAQAAAVQKWGNSPVAGPCNWELTRGRVEGDELRHFGDILWSLILEKLNYKILKRLPGSAHPILVQDKDKLGFV